MAGLAQSVEQVEMYLYVISHLMMMQEYELLRCDMAARVTGSSPVSRPQYGGVAKWSKAPEPRTPLHNSRL